GAPTSGSAWSTPPRITALTGRARVTGPPAGPSNPSTGISPTGVHGASAHNPHQIFHPRVLVVDAPGQRYRRHGSPDERSIDHVLAMMQPGQRERGQAHADPRSHKLDRIQRSLGPLRSKLAWKPLR